jgi:hypothetical protein
MLEARKGGLMAGCMDAWICGLREGEKESDRRRKRERERDFAHFFETQTPALNPSFPLLVRRLMASPVLSAWKMSQLSKLASSVTGTNPETPNPKALQTRH